MKFKVENKQNARCYTHYKQKIQNDLTNIS